MTEPNKMDMPENHCKDCCCARSWKALGVTEYTGKSIPEHIKELKARADNPPTVTADEAREALAALERFRFDALSRFSSTIHGVNSVNDDYQTIFRALSHFIPEEK